MYYPFFVLKKAMQPVSAIETPRLPENLVYSVIRDYDHGPRL